MQKHAEVGVEVPKRLPSGHLEFKLFQRKLMLSQARVYQLRSQNAPPGLNRRPSDKKVRTLGLAIDW
jgi:hypothetical protein